MLNDSIMSLSTNGTTTGPVPDISSPSHQSFNGSSRSIQGWSNVKVEDRLTGRLWSS